MANVKDAEVLLCGTVLSIEETTDRETQKFTGRKITIVTEEGGVSVVKLAPEDRVTVPARKSEVAWMIRNVPYKVGDNSGMSSRFVREFGVIDEEILTRIMGAATATTGK